MNEKNFLHFTQSTDKNNILTYTYQTQTNELVTEQYEHKDLKICPFCGGAAKLQNQTTKFCFEIFWRKSLRGF